MASTAQDKSSAVVGAMASITALSSYRCRRRCRCSWGDACCDDDTGDDVGVAVAPSGAADDDDDDDDGKQENIDGVEDDDDDEATKRSYMLLYIFVRTPNVTHKCL